MITDIFRPYRHPEAVIRVESEDSVENPGLEIVTHKHSEIIGGQVTKLCPDMIRHNLHAEISRGEKLSSIRITVEFDNPEHCLRAQYVKWADHETDHPVCFGNGRVANLCNDDKSIKKVKCLGPARCHISRLGSSPCMIDARLNALVEGKPVEVRTNSSNGFMALLSGLEYSKARADGVLSSAQMSISTWEKSTRGSNYKPFTTVNLNFEEFDADAPKVTNSMRSYGDSLLQEWESRFAVTADAYDVLEFPSMPTFAVTKDGERAMINGTKQQDLEALFQFPTMNSSAQQSA